MAFLNRGGHNPRWGRDVGTAPPIANIAQARAPGQAFHPWPPQMQYQYPQNVQYYSVPATYTTASGATYPYASGYGGSGRVPQPRPVVSSSMPAANLTNSTGGIGCEPGYNYFFPPEHTKIHVLKTGATPPWQFPANYTMPFHACHVPVSTTIGELLKGFGATNPTAKLNKVYEVTQGGNGTWYRGLCFTGDDKAAMKQTLKEVGWDKSRSGLPGGKPVVFLYITKD